VVAVRVPEPRHARPLSAFRSLFGKGTAKEATRDSRALVQRALRPVLLRRTKAQVLHDLPAKVEQTLWCDAGARSSARATTQLREHFRSELLAGGRPSSTAQQRFVLLEALLRLRQAACHEGLLDPAQPREQREARRAAAAARGARRGGAQGAGVLAVHELLDLRNRICTRGLSATNGSTAAPRTARRAWQRFQRIRTARCS
jgi:SNF2 family DNA or RNA helicase